MNVVVLIGRLTRDPELRYTQNQDPVCTFTLAVDNPYSRDPNGKADFIRITVFGKQAENCSKYLAKGSQAGVEGRIRTGSYQNKNGDTVYTTDVYANRVQFLGGRNSQGGSQGGYGNYNSFGGASGYGGDRAGYRNDRDRDRNGYDPAGRDNTDNDISGNNDGGYGDGDVPEGFVALEDDDDDNLPF